MFIFKRFVNELAMTQAMLADFLNNVNQLLCTKEILRIAIATGSTLEKFLQALQTENIPFQKIDLYIVDEYAGFSYTDPRSCTFDLYSLLNGKTTDFHSIKVFSAENYKKEVDKYNAELTTNGLDICVLGIGSDGHVGFCYPPVRHISDTYYEITELSEKRKSEHVANEWLPSIDSVPDNVITLSLWGIKQSSIIMIGAIYEKKKNIIQQMHKKEILPPYCPVLYLNEHKDITVYIG